MILHKLMRHKLGMSLAVCSTIMSTVCVGQPLLADAQDGSGNPPFRPTHPLTPDLNVRDLPASQTETPPGRRPLVPATLPPSTGQGPRMGGYYMLRYNDLYYKDDDRLFGFLKNIPLTDSADYTISFAGEERAVGIYQRYGSYAGQGGKDQVYGLLRHQVSADLNATRYMRAFAQVVSAQQIGDNFDKPVQARQDNNVDVAQLFVEPHFPALSGEFGLRAGRQQVQLGSGQIIAMQPAPNVMLNFDGYRGFYYSPTLRVDLLSLRPVLQENGPWDDGTNKNVALTGAYASLVGLAGSNYNVMFDPFYIHYKNDEAIFNRVAGEESRDTYGLRGWGKLGRANIDYSFMYQSGDFASKDISAHSLQTVTTLPLSDAQRPWLLGLQADYFTGGSRTAGKVKTFNPLYAGNQYLTINSSLSASNIIDLSPSLSIPVGEKSSLKFYSRWYWRYSTQDAIYGPGMNALTPSYQTDTRYVGMQPSAEFNWPINRNVVAYFSAGYFSPSQAMKDAGLKESTALRAELNFIY